MNLLLDCVLNFVTNNKMVSTIILLLILLIIVLIVRKRKPSTELQFVTHILLYLIEILTVTKIIIYFIGTNSETLLSIFRDYIFAYTIYQLLLLVTFKLKDSLDIDAFTSIKTLIDRLQLYGEFNEKIPTALISTIKEEGQKSGNVFNKKQRNELTQIASLAEQYNSGKISREKFRFILKEKSLQVDIELKIYSYGWMNSILLRMFK